MYRSKRGLILFCLTLFALVPHAWANLAADGGRNGSTFVQGANQSVLGITPVDLILDDGTIENTIGDAGQFIWLNVFTPLPDDFPFQLQEISVVFGGTLVNVGDAIELLVYSDTDADGDPGTGAVLVGSENVTVQFNDGVTFSVYNLTTPVSLFGPGDVIIGVVNRYGSEGFNDFPATLDTTATQGRSWAATYLAGDVPANPTLPGDEQWGTIDSFGFPGNWVVRGRGTGIVTVPALSNTWLAIFGTLILGAGLVIIRRRA